MRFKIMKQGGYAGGGITPTGGTVTGPLILSGNPLQPLEASTRSYLDSVLSNVNGANLVSGTIPEAVLPALTGDVVTNAGSSQFTLTNTGVTPGSYAKFTVDAKGRVTNGYTLSESDIPGVSWEKITSGKPTTLAGYGITDGIGPDGGILTGVLEINGSPTDNLHIVNREYVDNITAGAVNGVKTGDVVRKTTAVTPPGYLRCNGGTADKTTYAALYNVLGDTFSYDLQPGSGQPWRQQYQINSEPSADITGWTTGTSLPVVLAYSQAIVTRNRVYLLGGDNNTTGHTATVYTAPINSDGTLGTWTTGTSLPEPLTYSQAIVTKNRVYLLGGDNNTTGRTATVYTAPINSDGTLGTWTTGTSLPSPLGYSQVIITKNRVYLLGGVNNGGITSIVYTAPINSDGTLGTWTTGTSLPVKLAYSQAIVTKNRVYLLGGSIDDTTGHTSIVYTAPINSDGTLGTWTTGTSLPVKLAYSQAIVTKNRVYLLGGVNSDYTSTVYTAPINSDGTLGTWSTGTSLPSPLGYSQAIVTRNRVYLLGGVNNTTGRTATVYTAPFSGGLNDYSPYYDGTIQPIEPGAFMLPDYSYKELPGSYSYIKT